MPETTRSPPPEAILLQLPLYNEQDVVEELLACVAELDWPQELLHVQILDDSSDGTSLLVDRWAAAQQRAGRRVSVLRRADRRGYKGGALKWGMSQSDESLLAILDADFRPPPEWLREMTRQLRADWGMVQTRWIHANVEQSALTRAQAFLLDGHFIIEQPLRCSLSLFLNFNGTAGLWRRACIEAAGGWSGATLTEDLDLSYRAQLAGWRLGYSLKPGCPSELPADMLSFKQQQRRWATGTVQTARKILPRLLRSQQPLRIKLEALVHLTAHLSYVSMLFIFAVAGLQLLPAVQEAWWLPPGVNLMVFLLGVGGLGLYHLRAARLGGMPARSLIAAWPVAMLLSVGIGLSQATAVLKGLSGERGAFLRTPKLGSAALLSARYRLQPGQLSWAELLLGVALISGALLAGLEQQWSLCLLLSWGGLGFSYVGLTSLLPAAAAGDERAAPPGERRDQQEQPLRRDRPPARPL